MLYEVITALVEKMEQIAMVLSMTERELNDSVNEAGGNLKSYNFV